jgi:hypothetical protein
VETNLMLKRNNNYKDSMKSFNHYSLLNQERAILDMITSRKINKMLSKPFKTSLMNSLHQGELMLLKV